MNFHDPNDNAVNPATGLPMIGGIGGVDVAGNPFGTDLHHHGADSMFSSDPMSDHSIGFGSPWD